MKCAKLKNWKTEKLNSQVLCWPQISSPEFSFSVFQFFSSVSHHVPGKLKSWNTEFSGTMLTSDIFPRIQFFSFSSCTGRHHPSSDASNFSLLPQWACELTRPVRLSGKSWKNRAFLRELGTSTRPSLPRWHGFGFEENLCCMFPKKCMKSHEAGDGFMLCRAAETARVMKLTLAVCRWYARPHILFGDGVYHRVIFELRVNEEVRIRPGREVPHYLAWRQQLHGKCQQASAR